MENEFANQTVPSSVCKGFTCVIEIAIAIGVTLCVLLGNLVSLTVLISTPSLRNCHGYLLFSLTSADFGVGVFSALSVYPLATLGTSWPYGEGLCLITAYIHETCRDVSAMTLALLSVERYIAVVHPLRYSSIVTKNRALWAAVFSWVLFLSLYCVIFFDFFGFNYTPSLYTCLPLYENGPVYTLTLVLTLALPFALVILVTSILVRKSLLDNQRTRDSLTQSSTLHQGGAETNFPHNVDMKQTVKLFKMIKIMSVVFYACWVPHLTTVSYSIIMYTQPNQLLIFCTYWMLTSNSFLNTVIYFAMNKTYMERGEAILKKLLPTCCIQVNAWHQHVDKFCFRVFCGHTGEMDFSTVNSASSVMTDMNTVCNTGVFHINTNLSSDEQLREVNSSI